MGKEPLVFVTNARAKFSELDPYGHMNTQFYLSHFIEHRMEGMRNYLGWDLDYLTKLPFAFLMKEINVEFLRSVLGDGEFQITSHVTNLKERDFVVNLQMRDIKTDKVYSKCMMTVVCVNKVTGRSIPWPDEIIAKFYLT